MSHYSRDNSIYGHYLIPLALLAHEPEDPMQHLEDLKSDLAFSEESNRDGHLAFVPSSQETIKKCIADLEELVLLRARLAALEADKRRLDWRSNCTMFQANEVLRFCGENAMKHKGDHELYRAAIDHVMATVPGAFGDRSALSANPRLLSEGGEGK